MNQLITISYKDELPDGYREINCTSQGTDKYRQLSPFMRSDIYCYDNLFAKNVENAWQFSKVYPEQDNSGVPSKEWFKWRDNGFNDTFAHRYPMGKGKIPLYSYWDNKKYDYITARKNIYFPLFEKSIETHEVFLELLEDYKNGDMLAIRDFDVYRFDLMKMTFEKVVNNPKKKCGHGFVLYNMLIKNKTKNKKTDIIDKFWD